MFPRQATFPSLWRESGLARYKLGHDFRNMDFRSMTFDAVTSKKWFNVIGNPLTGRLAHFRVETAQRHWPLNKQHERDGPTAAPVFLALSSHHHA
jgi:hypothetical protein